MWQGRTATCGINRSTLLGRAIQTSYPQYIFHFYCFFVDIAIKIAWFLYHISMWMAGIWHHWDYMFDCYSNTMLILTFTQISNYNLHSLKMNPKLPALQYVLFHSHSGRVRCCVSHIKQMIRSLVVILGYTPGHQNFIALDWLTSKQAIFFSMCNLHLSFILPFW